MTSTISFPDILLSIGIFCYLLAFHSLFAEYWFDMVALFKNVKMEFFSTASWCDIGE